MCWTLNFTLMIVSMLVVSSGRTPFRPPTVSLACSDSITRETATYRVSPDCPSVILMCRQGTCPQVVILTFDHVQSLCFGHQFYGFPSYSVSTLTGSILVSEGRRECIPERTIRNVTLTLHGNIGQVIFISITFDQEENTISLHTNRASSLREALSLLDKLPTL